MFETNLEKWNIKKNNIKGMHEDIKKNGGVLFQTLCTVIYYRKVYEDKMKY